RRARGAAGQARGPRRPAAVLPAALGLLSLHPVLRGLGLPPDGRCARRAARELTGLSPVVSSNARCTSSAMASRAAGASREATASYTRWWSGRGSRGSGRLRCLKTVVQLTAAATPLSSEARKGLPDASSRLAAISSSAP